MKLFGRRSFLRVLGTAPLAGRAAAEAVAKELNQIGLSGGVPHSATLRDVVSNSANSIGEVGQSLMPMSNGWNTLARREAMRLILSDKQRGAEIRSILSQNYRRIHQIDPDIAGRHSWSLAAKIAYQRQRCVDQEIAEVHEASPWHTARNWVEDQLKNFLSG